ncbi:transcription factor [Stagonosporopsis vannaccii]|nr:transcription factor [Stagonosporopsis vannaccii]
MASGTKRMCDDDASLANTSKIQRIEHAAQGLAAPLEGASTGTSTSASAHPRLHHSASNHDFSGSVKRKLADSKRTGQACDRCKVRKIRCDGRPDGCTPCEQNRTQCRTTDRITGKATVRGHAEAMETENSYLRTHLADLQAQLKDMGVEPRPPPAYANLPWPPPAAAPPPPPEAQEWASRRRPSASPMPGYASASDKADFRSLPHFKLGSIGDNYLGVASGDSLLSHITGTSLSVFGTDIDITDFVQDGAEYESSPMSYQSLVKITMGSHHVDPVPLPPYEALKEWATWYLRSLNPYTMLVHKPAFMNLVWRFGNDPTFTPTAPETVMVHMMLATIKYQIAARNSQQSSLMEESHAHYQYACSFYKDLLLGQHELADIQALAMICHHLRNFPKPGAAWIMTSLTYLFALELGLHRSVKNWSESGKKFTELEIEMRKRIFWTMNALQINLAGKLGRPMPISNEDIDVEFPEPMNDCLPGEEADLTPFHRCSFQVGIQIAKHTVWELDLYKTIYAVKYTPRSYVESLKRLEAGIQKWKEELPYELRDPSRASQDDHIFASYLEYWYLEFQLLLHHPAVCRSVDPSILTSNLDKCMDAAQKMLHTCTEMMHKKSLDIVWINTVVYIAAVFTMLFISSMRKDLLTPVDMTRLKGDMATWIDVLGECSTEDKMRKAISKIVEQALGNINESIVKRTATESLARVALHTKQQQPTPQQPVYDTGSYNEQQYTSNTTNPADPSLTQNTTYTSLPNDNNMSMSYALPVSHQQTPTYDPQPYIKVDEEQSMAASHALAATSSAPQGEYSYPQSLPQGSNLPQASSGNAHQPSYVANTYSPQDWRQWTQSYMQQPVVGPQGEYLTTAASLMALGGRDGGGEGAADHAEQAHLGHFHWPGVAFPGAAGAGGH